MPLMPIGDEWKLLGAKMLSLMSIRYLFALSEVGSTQRKKQKLS